MTDKQMAAIVPVLDREILKVKSICCGCEFRLERIYAVPKQIFDRTCPACGFEYEITVTTLSRDREWLTFNKVEWD